MGGWDNGILFFIGVYSALSHKIDSSRDVPFFSFNSYNVPSNFANLYLPQEYTSNDLTSSKTSASLFNNILLMPPIKLESTLELENDSHNSKVASSYSYNLLDQDQSHDLGVRDAYQNNVSSPSEHQKSIDYIDEEALEKEAEALVEKEYHQKRSAVDQNAHEEYSIKMGNQKPSKLEVSEDHHGESSDYGHHSYVPYNEGEYEEYIPKKKNEIHYHQHKHLHEHDHLQEHKHQHVDEHKAQHHHQHKQYDDHKHYHEAKHEHKEKSEHYHKKYADHKHEHYQDHKHHHHNEHWHDHKQNAWHDHKAEHEHYHKEDAKHYHEKKAKHGHHHHHKHEEESKHHHNHWAENKHNHHHGHDEKHYHEHKMNHYHQQKQHKNLKFYYKKHYNHG